MLLDAFATISMLYLLAVTCYCLFAKYSGAFMRFDDRPWFRGGDRCSVTATNLYSFLRANVGVGANGEPREYYIHPAYDWSRDEIAVFRVEKDRVTRIAAFPLPRNREYARLRDDWGESARERYESGAPLRLIDLADTIRSETLAKQATDDFCSASNIVAPDTSLSSISWPEINVTQGGRVVRYSASVPSDDDIADEKKERKERSVSNDSVTLKLTLPSNVVAKLSNRLGYVKLSKDTPCGKSERRRECYDNGDESSACRLYAPVKYGDYVAYYVRSYDPSVASLARGTKRYEHSLPYFTWQCASTVDESPKLLPL